MLPLLDVVGWAVPPNRKTNTRPYMLINELSADGTFAGETSYHFHGRAESQGKFYNAGKVLPRIPGGDAHRAGALFSPIFHPNLQGTPIKWIDYYDDWSLAPDINRLHRWISKLSYDAVRRGRHSFMVTCNSPYMAGKLNLPFTAIVPNGVDEGLADLQRSGDDVERLIVLGHFFRGRTDYDLIIRVARLGIFKEILFGAPGDSREIVEVMQECRKYCTVLVFDWIDNDGLARHVGCRTAALIPHIVNDYTLSQDLMKVYQFLALGIKIMCPIELWPVHLQKDHSFLIGIGVTFDPNLKDWLAAPAMSEFERRDFAARNSWAMRAKTIRQKLEVLRAN